jgi:hypothetical protein
MEMYLYMIGAVGLMSVWHVTLVVLAARTIKIVSAHVMAPNRLKINGAGNDQR